MIVESVVKGRQADKLGVLPGDLLLHWSRGNIKGEFDSPFIVGHVAIEEASRGTVRVDGLRETQKHSWMFESDSWGIQTRPNFVGKCLAIYEEGIHLAEGGMPVKAAERLKSVAAISDLRNTEWLVPWFFSRAGRILLHAQEWQKSDDDLKESIDRAQGAGRIIRGELLRLFANSLQYRGELAKAHTYYETDLRESEVLNPETMENANCFLLLATVELDQDDMETAEAHLTHAFLVASHLAPLGFQMATILEDFGIIFEDRGDLAKAEEYYLKALRIEERYFPGSRQLASTLTNLGTLIHMRGDSGRSESYHRRALSIAEKVEENGPQIAGILNNLGESVLELGHSHEAEGYQKRALEIRERTVPGTLAA